MCIYICVYIYVYIYIYIYICRGDGVARPPPPTSRCGCTKPPTRLVGGVVPRWHPGVGLHETPYIRKINGFDG